MFSRKSSMNAYVARLLKHQQIATTYYNIIVYELIDTILFIYSFFLLSMAHFLYSLLLLLNNNNNNN